MQGGNRKSTLISRMVSVYKNRWQVRLSLSLTLLGLVYGYVSALHNQNPYYPVPKKAVPEKFWLDLGKCHENRVRAWNWQPSPFWLPSFLLCKLPPGEPGIGISATRSGYLFRSNAHRLLYRWSSTILGGFMGLLIAMAAVKIIMVKQGSRQDLPNISLPDSTTAKNKGK